MFISDWKAANLCMTKEVLKEYLQATPFRPFTVGLTDGRPCDVPARDFAHLAPDGRTLVVFTAGGDGVRLVNVALITEVEVPEAKPKQSLPEGC